LANFTPSQAHGQEIGDSICKFGRALVHVRYNEASSA